MEKSINDTLKNTIIDANIQMEYYDSELTPYKAVMHGFDMITSEKRETSPLLGLYGEFISARTIPLALVSSGYNILQCSGMATSPTLTDKNHYGTFFRTVPSDIFQGTALANFAFAHNWNKVAILNENGAYGQGVRATTFENEIDLIKKSFARIIIIIVYPDDLLKFMRRARIDGLLNSNYVFLGSDSTSAISSILQETSDMENFEGYIAISALDRVVEGNAYKSLNSEYQKIFNQTVPGYGGFVYDCIASLIYTFENFLISTNSTPSDYTTKFNSSSRVSLQNVQKIAFTGISGNVSIDENGEPKNQLYTVTNVVNKMKTSRVAGTVEGGNAKIIYNKKYDLVFNGGSTVVPSDSAGEYEVKLDNAGTIVVFAYFMLNLLITLGSIIFLIIKRKENTLKTLSVPFLFLISLGLLLNWLSIFSFLGKMTVQTCYLQQVLWLAFCLIFSSLLVKVFRIWRVFDHSGVHSVYLTDTKLFIAVSLLFIGEILILVAWAVVNPPVPTIVNQQEYFYVECLSDNLALQTNFNLVLIVYNGLILCVVMYLAYKTRNVSSAYKESSWITQLSLNVLLCASIPILLLFTSNDNSILNKFYIKMLTLAFGTSVTYFCLIGRVILSLVIIQSSKKIRQNRKQKFKQTTSIIKSAISSTNKVIKESLILKKFTVMSKNEKIWFSNWKNTQITINEITCNLHYLKHDFMPNPDGISISMRSLKFEDMGFDTLRIFTAKLSFIILCSEEGEKNRIISCLRKVKEKDHDPEVPNDAVKGGNTAHQGIK
ncbi:hypothetical protein HK099_000534 [Clydaea vesicula]|uniref:G-protein coupled receptors family 3 profile domain-containing protein n=1 Tax=Clydaea vesicula TaxID=447962 RepID=A0AAD5TZB7_9FUNG|nr:hypothetical protein HK099_000534 [Clydaea vesicula]